MKYSKRAETGPMLFGKDWCGVFIRGDNAAYYSLIIKQVLDSGELNAMERMQLASLADLLQESDHRNGLKEVQKMKDFDDCVDLGI
jgi:hypothetical protein